MEKEYIVFFEFFGRKMKSVVYAENEAQAKEKIKERLFFHKVEEGDKDFNQIVDLFENFKNQL